jgi:hypothetical protein
MIRIEADSPSGFGRTGFDGPVFYDSSSTKSDGLVDRTVEAETGESVSSSDFDRREDFLGETDLGDWSSTASSSLASMNRTSIGATFSPTLKSFGSDVMEYLKIELGVLFQDANNFAAPTASGEPFPVQVQSGSQSKSKETQHQKSNGKRPDQNRDSISADEREDDPPKKRSKKCPPNSRSGQICPKLACPFFKNNPSKYQSWTSCLGPGWDSMHRVKYVVISIIAMDFLHRCVIIY